MRTLLVLICLLVLSRVNAADQLFEAREGRYQQTVWLPEQDGPLRGMLLDCIQWRYGYDPTILRETARSLGFAYVTTTTRQGKGLTDQTKALDTVLKQVSVKSKRSELPKLPVVLLLTQDQTPDNFVHLLLRHFDGRVIGIVGHAPVDMLGKAGKKKAPMWRGPVLAIAGGETSRFNREPDMREVFRPARAAGAQWALARQPFADQEFVPWFDVIVPWISTVTSLRLQSDGSLKDIDNTFAHVGSRLDESPKRVAVMPIDRAGDAVDAMSWFPTKASGLAWMARQNAELQNAPLIGVSSGSATLGKAGLMRIPSISMKPNHVVTLTAPERATFYISPDKEIGQGTQAEWQMKRPGVFSVSARLESGACLRPAIVVVSTAGETKTHKLYTQVPEPRAFPDLAFTDQQRAEAETLLHAMETHLAKLGSELHGGRNMQFVLRGAGDGDDAFMSLNVDTKTAEAYVPAWNQDTFNAGYGFHFRNGGGALYKQRHFFPVDLVLAPRDENALQVESTWNVRRNRWRHERMPPGNSNILPGMPGPYSMYDALAPEVHVKERYRTLDMVVEPQPGRYWVDLQVSGLADGRAATLKCTWPAQPGEPQIVNALHFNSAPHSVDVSELTIDQAGVRGTIQFVFNPDRWVPKDRLRRRVRLPLKLSVNEATDIDVPYSVTVNGRTLSGRVRGSITPLWSGTYSSDELTGPVFGGDVPAPSSPTPEGLDLVARFNTVWTRTAFAAQRSQEAVGLMAPAFASAEEALSWMRDIHAQCLSITSKKIRSLPDRRATIVPIGSKRGSSTAATEKVWKHPEEWKTYGPLPVLGGNQESANPVLPPFPLRAGQRVHFDFRAMSINGKGVAKGGPRWGKAHPDNGLFFPHFFKSSMYIPRSSAVGWQGYSSIKLNADAEVVLRVDCIDAGQLWVNGKLVYSSSPQDFRLHQTRISELSVPMKAGGNELVWYVRADYGRTWARLQYAVNPPATTPIDAPVARLPDAPENLSVTAWSQVEGFRKSEPAVNGQHVGFLRADGSFAVRDLTSGELRWQSESLVVGDEKATDRHAKPLALEDGWIAHVNDGKIAAFKADGDVRWQRHLPMTDASLYRHKKHIIVIGRPVLGTDAKGRKKKMPRGVFLYSATALNLMDGSVAWAREFAANGRPSSTKRGGGGGPGIYQNWTQFVAWLQSGDHAALLVRGGVVLDAETGEEILPHLDTWVHGERHWTVWGNWLFASSHGQLVAFKWGFDEKGTFVHQEVWRVRNELSSFGNSPTAVVCDGKYVYHHRPIPEHAPHCPALWTALDVHELETGNPVSRMRPVMKDVEQYRFTIPAGVSRAGPVAFFQDSGGGNYARDPHGELAVVALGAEPRLLQRWKSEGQLAVPPVLTARGLLVRERNNLTLLTAGDPSTRTAAALMEFIGHKPANPLTADLASMDGFRHAEPVVSKITPQFWTMRWQKQKGWAQLPDGVLRISADAGKGLLPFSSYNLQGRGITPFGKQVRLDIGKLFQGKEGQTVELRTVIHVPRDRCVRLGGLVPGVHASIGSHPLVNGQKFRLRQGNHPLNLRIGPDFFIHPPRIMPIDQQAAIEAGRLRAQDTPDWQYFAPFSESANLSAAQRQALATNGRLSIDGETWLPHVVPTDKEYRWLAPLMVLAPDQPYQKVSDPRQGFAPGVIYAVANYDAPADGHIVVHASADWFMQWWVNGAEVYTTNGRGNARGPEDVQAHTIVSSVKKGANQVVVRIQSGSKGIGLASRWSFTKESDFAKLADDFPNSRGVVPPKPYLRISPSLTTIPDPNVAMENWRARARSVREDLVALAESDSPMASRAKSILRVLK